MVALAQAAPPLLANALEPRQRAESRALPHSSKVGGSENLGSFSNDGAGGSKLVAVVSVGPGSCSVPVSGDR